MDRYNVKFIVCHKCGLKQKKQDKCEQCDICFAEYFCEICSLYETSDRDLYHCEKCNTCRVGPRHNYFHCDICDMCLTIELRDNHKCVSKTSKSNCPICLEYLFDSVKPLNFLQCGHSIHLECFINLIKQNIYKCPICNKTVADASKLWKYYDKLIENQKKMFSKDYVEHKDINILCNDCCEFSNTNYNSIAIKCINCGSYNTTINKRLK